MYYSMVFFDEAAYKIQTNKQLQFANQVKPLSLFVKHFFKKSIPLYKFNTFY